MKWINFWEFQMKSNKELFLKTLLQNADNVTDRYDGYKEDFKNLLAEVVQAEKEHQVARTNIVQKLADKIELAGQDLEKETNKNEA